MRINILKEYRGLPQEIYMLFAANIINRFGDFVAPFLTLYLSSKLNLNMNITGIIVTVCVLSRIPGSILGGKMTDNYGRKKSYLIFQTLAGVLLLPCAVLTNSYIVITLIILSTFFNGGVRPALEALAMDIIPEEKRKTGFSLMYLGINIGVATGPALAGFLFKTNLPLFFIIDTTTSLMAVAIVIFKIKEKYVIEKHIKKAGSKPEEGMLKIISMNPHIIKFILLTSGFALAYTQSNFSLPILLEELFKGSGAAKLGILFNINALTVLIMTTWIISKIKNNSSIKNLCIAGLFYATGFAGYALLSNFAGFIIATVVWTVGEIIQFSNEKMYIAEHTEAKYRGRINAISSSLKYTMNSLTILLGGFLIPLIGVRKIWIFCVIIPLMISMALRNFKEESSTKLQKI